MKKFLAVYIGTEAALQKAQWSKLDEQKRKALDASGIKAWMDWGAANGAAIVDQGSPLGKTKCASLSALLSIPPKGRSRGSRCSSSRAVPCPVPGSRTCTRYWLQAIPGSG